MRQEERIQNTGNQCGKEYKLRVYLQNIKIISGHLITFFIKNLKILKNSGKNPNQNSV